MTEARHRRWSTAHFHPPQRQGGIGEGVRSSPGITFPWPTPRIPALVVFSTPNTRLQLQQGAQRIKLTAPHLVFAGWYFLFCVDMDQN